MGSDAEIAAEMRQLEREFQQAERQNAILDRESEIHDKEAEICRLFDSLKDYYLNAARYAAHPALFERNRQRIKDAQSAIEKLTQNLIELRHPKKLAE